MSGNNLREWTVMVYCAADNDLSRFAIKNLLQMLSVGATDKVHIVAQVDLFGPTSRYTFLESGGWKEETIPEANTGAVKDFVDFVEWGAAEEHKANRYLIVLWGHGDGPDDDQDNEQPVDSLLEVASEATVAATAADIAIDVTTGLPPPAGRETFAIGAEVNPIDALTTRELATALKRASDKLGGKIHVFGMDACLMGMVEVAQEISPSVQLMVASQQSIPDTSWPYDRILRRLVAQPTMKERELATALVDEYVEAYKNDVANQVTLSVCDLEKTPQLVSAFTVLRKALDKLVPIPALKRALLRARRRSLSFLIRDYVDLYGFCKELSDILADPGLQIPCRAAGNTCDNVRSACKAVMEAIHQEDQTGFVIVAKSNSAPGGALERARGVSVYFPILSSLYKELVFSKQTEWPGFLLDYASAFLDNKGPNESHALLEAAAETAYVSTVEIEANGNGHQPNSGGIGNMSSPMEVSKAPCLALFEGTTIEEPSKPVKELTGLAFLEMGANRKVRIPGDVDLNVPNTGTVKASTGTPLKLPTGTMVGSAGPSAIAVPMKVPACTLREPSNGNATTELSDGTRIVTNVGGTGFLVLEAIEFGVDDGA